MLAGLAAILGSVYYLSRNKNKTITPERVADLSAATQAASAQEALNKEVAAVLAGKPQYDWNTLERWEPTSSNQGGGIRDVNVNW